MPLVRFYVAITTFQSELGPLDGPLVQAVQNHFPRFLERVVAEGPPALAEAARAWSAGPTDWDRWWETREAPAVQVFFFRTFAQPWAERRAARAVRGPVAGGAANRCPVCGDRPQVGLLRSSSEGAPLFLCCATCATCWPFPRIVCTACLERDPAKLALHVPVDERLVRLHSCDTCRSYLKVVDLGVDGRAVPVVDELASVALDVWAREHGYAKVEPNLIGL